MAETLQGRALTTFRPLLQAAVARITGEVRTTDERHTVAFNGIIPMYAEIYGSRQLARAGAIGFLRYALYELWRRPQLDRLDETSPYPYTNDTYTARYTAIATLDAEWKRLNNKAIPILVDELEKSGVIEYRPVAPQSQVQGITTHE